MSEQLLPCPFCGDTELEGGAPFPLNRSGVGWVIRCGNPLCFAEIERAERYEAVKAWNRRAPSAEQQQQEPVAKVGRDPHELEWLSQEAFDSVPIGTPLYTHQQPQARSGIDMLNDPRPEDLQLRAAVPDGYWLAPNELSDNLCLLAARAPRPAGKHSIMREAWKVIRENVLGLSTIADEPAQPGEAPTTLQVSDEIVERASKVFWAEFYKPGGSDNPRGCMRAALEAALKGEGE